MVKPRSAASRMRITSEQYKRIAARPKPVILPQQPRTFEPSQTFSIATIPPPEVVARVNNLDIFEDHEKRRVSGLLE